jgi:hypothetical protein
MAAAKVTSWSLCCVGCPLTDPAADGDALPPDNVETGVRVLPVPGVVVGVEVELHAVSTVAATTERARWRGRVRVTAGFLPGRWTGTGRFLSATAHGQV